MAWDGLFVYAGTEIVNAPRTEAYAYNAGITWLRPQFNNDDLHTMLGDTEYLNPFQDESPWGDPNDGASYDMLGLYPLDVSGIEDSPRTSTVIESVANGGVAGRIRFGTKTIVFNTALIATSDAGAEYGMRWLRQALLGNPCGGSLSTLSCNGEELCYLSSEPALSEFGSDVTEVVVEETVTLDFGDANDTGLDTFDGGDSDDTGVVLDGGDAIIEHGTQTFDPEECLDPYWRHLHRVTFTTGPTATAKYRTSDGGAVWLVTFTAVAGNPFIYGSEAPVVQGFLNPDVIVPYPGGTFPEGGAVDLAGTIYSEAECEKPSSDPVYDPLAGTFTAPPAPPTIPLGSYAPPKNWFRRQFTVPGGMVPLWGEVVPKFSVHARDADLRNLRLRFYADPDGDGDTYSDPCAYCGDFVISYVPQGGTLVIDGLDEQVYLLRHGRRRRADSLVFQTDGTPFQWLQLSCGHGYVVTVDLPQTQTPPVIDLSLFPRSV